MKNTESTPLHYTTTSTSISESLTETEQKSKSVPNTPLYYRGKYKGIEAFDVCMDFARDSYNIGVAIAYLLRAGKKPGNPMVNDLLKAIDHINKELEYIGYDLERTDNNS